MAMGQVWRRAVSLHGDELAYWELAPSSANSTEPGADEEKEVVVLVHGVVSQGQTWAPVLGELARRGARRRFIAPDLLGYAGRPPPGRGTSGRVVGCGWS